jgi:hypothetical protein
LNNPDHIFLSLETIFLLFFGLKYLNYLMRIRDPGWRQFGSGMEKSWIRDKHPGSATLASSIGCRTRRLQGEEDWLQDGKDKLQKRQEDGIASSIGCRTRRIG